MSKHMRSYGGISVVDKANDCVRNETNPEYSRYTTQNSQNKAKRPYTTHTYTECGDSYKDAYTTALGHTCNAGVVTEESTCTKDGMKTYTCETCGKGRTETIKATGHDYEDGICGSCGAE